MTPTELGRWLQLTLAPGQNAACLKLLWQAAGSLEGLAALAVVETDGIMLSPAALSTFLAWQQGSQDPVVDARVQQALRWAGEPGHRVLAYGDADYPPLLYACVDPPPQLFIRGEAARLSLPQLAIVGSRHPTVDGRRLARQFSRELAERGWQITSGLALGIDAESHEAALATAAGTLAVLGSGIDNVQPVSNRRLAAAIAANGAVVSEFPPGAPAQAWHFPERNRLISGLSHGVLVVEAAERSGSLITARLAAEQGREVFAIPGSIRNPLTRGCHRLIRQGAKLVERVEDIMEELPALLAWQRAQSSGQPQAGALSPSRELPAPQAALLAHLGFDALPIDALLLRTAQPVEELLPLLLQLELAGLIEVRVDGYVRCSA
ncbi:MAG: DNA-processing protein DprA [Pseudohongiellaceae bacterium]